MCYVRILDPEQECCGNCFYAQKVSETEVFCDVAFDIMDGSSKCANYSEDFSDPIDF